MFDSNNIMRSLRSMAPPVVLNLILVNCIVFFATNVLGLSRFFTEYFALWGVTSPYFRLYQIVTYMFMHGGLGHLFFNMFALWMFGRTLENVMGQKRFLTYYMVCGVGAGLIQLAVGGVGAFTPTVGASGAVFGLLLAFGMMYPNAIITLMFPPIPIKAKYFVIIYGCIELFLGVSSLQVGVAHFAHLGGMLWGYLLLMYWKNESKWRKRR